MIAFARKCPAEQATVPAWHEGFIAILPQVRRHLRFAFRKMPPDERAEATAEAIADVAAAYARLHQRGKANLAFATTLADFAIRHYYAGRRVGNQLNINDATSPYAQRQRGFRVKSLDQRDPSGAWKEIVVEDRRCTPAEVAASRLDLDDWFDQLPQFKRGIAQTLATGESTGETARRFQVTAGRVSQIRRELEDDWHQYQGEPLVCA
jgi:hypothetical protein